MSPEQYAATTEWIAAHLDERPACASQPVADVRGPWDDLPAWPAVVTEEVPF